MLLEIALVAFLGLPEGGGGLDLGDDRAASTCPKPRPWSRSSAATRACPAPWVKITERYWVPKSGPWRFFWVGLCMRKNSSTRVRVGHLGGVEGHFHHLGMIGVAVADLAVGRVLGGAAGIAADRVADARDLAEEVLHPPEAARAEQCLFHDPSPAFP